MRVWVVRIENFSVSFSGVGWRCSIGRMSSQVGGSVLFLAMSNMSHSFAALVGQPIVRGGVRR